MYEFVGEAEKCEGEEDAPFEFLQVTLEQREGDVPESILDGNIYANGEKYGTVVTGAFPKPDELTSETIEILYEFVHDLDSDSKSQLAVSEVAPGDPDYSGAAGSPIQ